MSTLLKALALQFIAGRTVGGVFALLLGLLAPLVIVLKFIGLPILLVLAVVGAPLFLLLSVIGLPFTLVAGIGGSLMLALGMLLAIGLVILKIALPIILVVWFVRWVLRKTRSEEPVVMTAEPGFE